MQSSIVLHAAGAPSTWHALVDTGVGIGAGVLMVALFYLWLRRTAGTDQRRTGLE